MQNVKCLVQWSCVPFISAAVALLLAGCQSDDQSGVKISLTQPALAVTAPAVTAPAVTVPAVPVPVVAIRIKAGATAAYTDSSGNVWLPDQGFVDGDVVERDSDMQVANTRDQGLYRSERYGMSSFSYKLPNGKYIVKLHFAETYRISPGRDSASFPLTLRAMISRILIFGPRPAAPSAPILKPSTWISPTASWTSRSRPTFKAPRLTGSKSFRLPNCGLSGPGCLS